MDGPVGLAAAVKTFVRRLGGAFMKSPQAAAGAAALDLDPFAYYFGGRASVLGDVDADVVAAVFGFFPTGFVREHWVQARTAADPQGYLIRYSHTCHSWGRERLRGMPAPQAERLGDLMQTVVDVAGIVGSPLFAGWRRVPVPDEPRTRVAHLAHVLREHRGSAHLTAVRAAGLAPIEAIVTRDNGVERARFLGWPQPYPRATAALQQRRLQVEDATDRLAAPAYAVLTKAEADDLRALLASAYEVAMRSCI